MVKVETYRTLRLPAPEGNVALIFPEDLTRETATMLLEIFAAQFERYCKSPASTSLESMHFVEGDQQ